MQICCVLLYTTFFEADFSLFLIIPKLDFIHWLDKTKKVE